MLDNVTVDFIHAEVDKELEDYALKKFGKLDKLIPRSQRQSSAIEVRLIEQAANKTGRHKCEAELSFAQHKLVAEETTNDMHASIDKAESKLERQLRKEKAKRINRRQGNGLVGRVFRR